MAEGAKREYPKGAGQAHFVPAAKRRSGAIGTHEVGAVGQTPAGRTVGANLFYRG